MNDVEFAASLKSIAGDPGTALPEAEVIWWRAQLRRRLEAEERATRPIRLVERLACSVCVLAAAVLAASLWN
jgi:hypothetical protein